MTFLKKIKSFNNILVIYCPSFCLKKSAKDWDDGMEGAATGGSLDLVKFFIDKGAKDWEGGMKYAAQGLSLIHI